jgi:hypothetical protein
LLLVNMMTDPRITVTPISYVTFIP